MLGNHLPRHCGIATFTTDLIDAIEREAPEAHCFVVAMNDVGARHAYPPRVRFEILEGDVAAYRRAADFLNVNAVDVLSVQHEYGIFGGASGGHVLELLRDLRMPVVATLHTILERPDPVQRAVLEGLIGLAERLVVMSGDGAELLQRVHGVDPRKIDTIPHGIPVPPDRATKDRLGVEGRSVILTLGLLSPDKGIEYVIDAMPTILARHPNAVYVVLGATHPHVRQRYGEAYRQMLQARAERLGVEGNVIFHNRFVSHAELVEFLGAADLYATPYLKEEQSTSGTLAYAVGCGKAVVSTPYRYARELLADGRGVLVPWRDSEAIGREIVSLLDDPVRRAEMQRRASEFGRAMGWPIVARRYLASFEQAKIAHDERLRTGRASRTLAKRRPELPEIDLGHVRRMTDDTGMLQHAAFSVPRYTDGYCLDDNARALLLIALVEDAGVGDPAATRALGSRFLAFVCHAYHGEVGRFRNFMTYRREWTEACGSEDAQGRALWALGAVVGRSRDPGRQSLGGQLFHGALPAAAGFESPRGWAFALLGIDEYLRAFQGDSDVQALRALLSERLLGAFARNGGDDWPWCEDIVSYDNARLPQALIVSGARMGSAKMTDAGLASLDWLAKIQCSEERYFAPVGSNGFYRRGGDPALFDQQPIEACAMVSACLDAYRLTGDARWAREMRRAFRWFLGQNHLHASLYDPSTGGCRDGLHLERLNENQGAESTLSFLLALTEMGMLDEEIRLHDRRGHEPASSEVATRAALADAPAQ